jgi:nucleoside 2-deoxyribosyltransferase
MPALRRQQVYLAAPLFSQMERQWNRAFAERLAVHCPGIEVILPQDFRVAGAYNDPRHFGDLFGRCTAALKASDAVVAVLDGADADSGVSFEVGVAWALGIPVVGVRSDYREGQEKGLNLMLAQGCSRVVREYAFQEETDLVASTTARRLEKILPGLANP